MGPKVISGIAKMDYFYGAIHVPIGHISERVGHSDLSKHILANDLITY